MTATITRRLTSPVFIGMLGVISVIMQLVIAALGSGSVWVVVASSWAGAFIGFSVQRMMPSEVNEID